MRIEDPRHSFLVAGKFERLVRVGQRLPGREVGADAFHVARRVGEQAFKNWMLIRAVFDKNDRTDHFLPQAHGATPAIGASMRSI